MDLSELETILEIYFHADIYCLEKGALVLSEYEQPVNVQGYDPVIGPKTFRTISGALGYDHPYKGRTYYIVIQQAIEMPKLAHHMMCTIQVSQEWHRC